MSSSQTLTRSNRRKKGTVKFYASFRRDMRSQFLETGEQYTLGLLFEGWWSKEGYLHVMKQGPT